MFIFEKCTYDELQDIRHKEDLLLSGWQLLEKEYIDKTEKIYDEDGRMVALINYYFFNESKEKMMIALFEVFKAYRNKGLGKATVRIKGNINYINPILSIYAEDEMDGMDEYQAYSEIIKENIDMESLMRRYPYEQKDVQEIYELIVETVVGKGGSMIISGQQYPRALVKSRFLKLNMSHVEYVMECVRKNTTKIHNIKAYLLAAVFNAGTTMSNYYRAEVNHDMPQFAGGFWTNSPMQSVLTWCMIEKLKHSFNDKASYRV